MSSNTTSLLSNSTVVSTLLTNSTALAGVIDDMNSTEIISLLTVIQAANYSLTYIDMPYVLSTLDYNQIVGLLSANSSAVSTLLQSLNATDLLTVVYNFQDVTGNLFETATNTTNSTLASTSLTQATTLVTLLLYQINYTFLDSQILGLMNLLTDNAALGTGAKKLVDIAHDLLDGFLGDSDIDYSISIPHRLLQFVVNYLPATFGDYPKTRDIAPSSIFMSIFIIYAFIYGWLFWKNMRLGHRFLITLVLCFYSILRFLGFLLRIVWAKDFLKLDTGIASVILIILPTVLIPSMNLILAQRYFTWKHPLYGSHYAFTVALYVIYTIVIALVVMTIVAACVQNIYLLSESHYEMTKKVIRVTAVCISIYSLIAIALVVVAFVVPKTSADKEVLTLQPYWIRSFKWNYFVEKDAAAKELALIPEEQKHAISVINSTVYHHDRVRPESASEETTYTLDHSFSIAIIAFSSVALFLGSMFRLVSTFLDEYNKDHSWIYDPVVMYVMFGALETLVNAVYLYGRIDLRFYRPSGFVKPRATKDIPMENHSNEGTIEEKKAAADDV